MDVISPFATKNIQNTRMIGREYDLAQVEAVWIAKLCDIYVVLMWKLPYEAIAFARNEKENTF